MSKMVNEYLDIGGVKLVFRILKDKMKLSKEELLSEIESNTKKIDDLKNDLTNNYYTKVEVDALLPEELTEKEVDSAFDKGQNN